MLKKLNSANLQITGLTFPGPSFKIASMSGTRKALKEENLINYFL